MRKTMIALAALTTCAFATPAMAQQSSYKAGDLWVTSRIDVEDGQFETYMDWLNKVWVPNQEFAKSQGWINGYHILNNINNRDGEPNLILITHFANMPSVEEGERRDAIMNQRMSQDDHSADAASGQRTKMRKQMGSTLYRELLKR